MKKAIKTLALIAITVAAVKGIERVRNQNTDKFDLDTFDSYVQMKW